MYEYNLMMAQMIQPMREELTRVGFQELLTPEEVDAALPSAGTTLVMVNSVCGCAAGLARPAVVRSLQNDVVPEHLVTVFAGQEKEATAQARNYFTGYAPSSPSVALIKDGKLVHMIERHEIEGQDPMSIVHNLTSAYEKYCTK
ncbi:MAG: hypothetical protein JWN30_1346 [Bacilli bacterium]|nr:hypothetical protein [Bacilli bacterium]